MKIIPPRITGSPSEGAIPELTLVCFEHDGAPVLGAVRGIKKGKYTVLSMRNREVELVRERMHVLPLPGIGPITSSSLAAQSILEIYEKGLASASSLPMEEIWSAAREDRVEYTTRQIAELYFGNNDRDSHLAVRFALLRDSLFFKRLEADRFAPRPPEVVEELKKAEEARLRREDHERIFAKWLSSSSMSEQAPPELREDIQLLELCAASADEALPRAKEIDSLLSTCERAIGQPLHGTREQKSLSLLLKVGHFTPRTNLSIIRHQIEEAFQVEEITAARTLESTALAAPSKSRRDLTHLDCITIDDSSTLDMDDALSLTPNANGFTLGIHISDVQALIPPNSTLDYTALRRATSLYLADRTIPMLPKELSEGGASLVEGKDRLTLSVLIHLDTRCNVLSHEILPSIIRSRARLSYDALDPILEEERDETLSRMYRIAIDHETRRIENGAIRVHKRDALVSTDDNGKLILAEIDETSPARLMVSEMMVWANSLIATWADQHKTPIIYRCQDASDPNLERTLSKIPQGPAYDFAIRTSLKRSEVSSTPRRHASLGLDAYCQCTSPIRRYADLLVQRQIMGTLMHGKAPYTHEDLSSLLQSIEPRLGRANLVARESKRFWLLTYLRAHPELMESIGGTVVRTDLKNPLIELDVVYITILAKSAKPVSLGEEVRVKISDIDPQRDLIRAEVVSVGG